MILNDIAGQFHVKRAIEVALAGGHTITLVGSDTSGAKELVDWANSHGGQGWATVTGSCKCGYFGVSPRCRCSIREVDNWQQLNNWQQAMEADIVVECPEPWDWQTGTGEADEAMLASVSEIGPRPPLELDDHSSRLMAVAQNQLSIDRTQVLAVAQTIAALAHSDGIQTAHLAEAIQYRPGRNLKGGK